MSVCMYEHETMHICSRTVGAWVSACGCTWQLNGLSGWRWRSWREWGLASVHSVWQRWQGCTCPQSVARRHLAADRGRLHRSASRSDASFFFAAQSTKDPTSYVSQGSWENEAGQVNSALKISKWHELGLSSFSSLFFSYCSVTLPRRPISVWLIELLPGLPKFQPRISLCPLQRRLRRRCALHWQGTVILLGQGTVQPSNPAAVFRTRKVPYAMLYYAWYVPAVPVGDSS